MPGDGGKQSTADDLFAGATAQWPEVEWDHAAFVRHLAGESPKYSSDLYLGGAAGHRLDAAWRVIERDLGPGVRRVLARFPTADFTVDDLWGDSLARLMEDHPGSAALPDGRFPARIVQYRGLVPLLNYIILVGRRLAVQRQRERVRRPVMSLASAARGRRADVDGNDGRRVPDPADRRTVAPDAAAEGAEIAGRMRSAVGRAFAALSIEQQFLITMVYRQGMKQKAAGALLGWSEFKTSRQLSAAMNYLRTTLMELVGVEWTPVLATSWAECLQACWDDVAARAASSAAPSGGMSGGRPGDNR